MKILLVFLSIAGTLMFEFNKINLGNELKNKAAAAFNKKNYALSIRYYHELYIGFKENDENLLLNLAQSYFKIGDLKSASGYYKKIARSNDPRIRSLVNQQLGVILAYQGKNKEALNYLKAALKASPSNQEARFDFEIIYKKLKGKGGNKALESENQKKVQSSKTPQNNGSFPEPSNTNMEDPSTQMSPTSQKGEEKKSDHSPSITEDSNGGETNFRVNQKGAESADALENVKFNEIQMSEAKAKEILQTMKAQEFMLIRQKNTQRNQNTKKTVKNDW